MSPPSRTARCLARVLLAVAAALGPASCGDDGGKPPASVSPGSRDAGGGRDAGPEAGISGAGGGPSRPPIDAGRDAGGRDGAPDPDDDAGTPSCRTLDCSHLTDECNVGVCDEASATCRAEPRADGTECGDRALDHCTAPDTCRAGVCEPNHRAAGTPCGPQNVACHVNDTCDGSGVCVDRGFVPPGTPCGSQDDDDCTDPDTCDAAGVCQPNHAPADTVCADLGQPPGTLCNFDDRCNGEGECVDQGVWDPETSCPLGEEQGGCLCGRAGPYTQCHPGPDLCDAGVCRRGYERFATDGLTCGDATPLDPECDEGDTCLEGICRQNPKPLGTACGDRDTDTACNRPDSCDGFGNCSPNLAVEGTICNPAPDECSDDQRCDAAGNCLPPQQAPEGTACGDPSDSICDRADTCDASGECQSNLAAPGTACGDGSSDACSAPDSCDGVGTCNPNHAPLGAPCGDQGQLCRHNDACDGEGVCQDSGLVDPCPMFGRVFAGGSPAPSVTVAVVGGQSTTTDMNGEYQLEVPLGRPVLLRVGDLPGYYGQVRVRRFEPEELESSVDHTLRSNADMEIVANSVVPALAVDRDKGMIAVSLSGSGAGGGESVSISASSAGPLLYVPPSMFAYGGQNDSSGPAFVALYDVAPGTTSFTVTDGPANECAATYEPEGGWPVFAHTATEISVLCE